MGKLLGRCGRLALGAATVGLLAGCAAGVEPGARPRPADRSPETAMGTTTGTSRASCPAVVEHGGATYLGHGDLRRDPPTTGRRVPGVLPACDEAVEQDRPVQVAELVDVPLGTAFVWHGTVFVREGRELPAVARSWFEEPRCTHDGELRLVGDWLGVEAARPPRFDGDLRAPYRLEMHVTSGPQQYVAATVTVRVTARTEPRLRPEDVRASLWEGGEVAALVRCEGGRFEARSVHVPAP
jgi:hypothetical protein